MLIHDSAMGVKELRFDLERVSGQFGGVQKMGKIPCRS